MEAAENLPSTSASVEETGSAYSEFEQVPVPGDNNCLFGSLAYFVFGDVREHGRARAEIVSFLRTDDAELILLLHDYLGMAPSEYVSNNRMDEVNTWGGFTELEVAATLAQAPIIVFRPRHVTGEMERITAVPLREMERRWTINDTNRTGDQIVVVCAAADGHHYDAMIPARLATIPAGPVQQDDTKNTLYSGFSNVNGYANRVRHTKELIERERFDVFAVLETKADYNVSDLHVIIPNYQMQRANSIGQAGGIIVYVSEKVEITKVHPTVVYYCVAGYVQAVTLEIRKDNVDLVIMALYISQHSPEAVKFVRDYCNAEFADCLDRLIIIGDFNSDPLAKGTIGPLIEALDGIQTVRQPTRGEAILDLVILGQPDAHVWTKVLPPIAASDHRVVTTTLSLPAYAVPMEEEDIDQVNDEPVCRTGVERIRFTCSEDGCDVTFHCRAALKVHFHDQHSGGKQYVCEFCDVRLASKTSLDCHVRCHTGENPYECSRCFARFRYRGYLTTHVRVVHECIRPFKCKQCGEAFGTTSDLQKHHRIHTGERPYKCPDCPYSCKHASNLRRHRRDIHNGEKAFTCEKCHAQFTSKSNLLISDLI